MNDYNITTDNLLPAKDKIWSMLKDCFWCKNIPIAVVEKFINHSLCFGIYHRNKNELVGFGRVITDYTTYAYICDIVIDPAHRRKGLATALVSAIVTHPELQGLKTWTLRTTENARKIYEACGFKIANQPESLLEIEDLEIYSC